jgi:hypothetical protein
MINKFWKKKLISKYIYIKTKEKKRPYELKNVQDRTTRLQNLILIINF